MADILVYGKQGSGRLPAGYQELEYIESSGTQYIDTNFNPSSHTDMEVKTKSNSQEHMIFGVYSTYKYAINMYASGALYHLYIRYGTHSSNEFYTNAPTSEPVVFSCVGGKFYYGETLIVDYSTDQFSKIDKPIFLFANNNGGKAGLFYKGKIYYFKLTDDGTLVRNFIPAKRISDSEVGMFDLASNTFFTNAGTGSFIAGPEVGLPEGYAELEYIQASGQEYISGGTSTNTYYIDTLFTPSLSTKMEIKTCFDSFNQENLHGASYNGRFAFGGTYTPTAVNWYCGFRNVNADTGFLRDTNVHIFELDANNGTFTVDRTNTYTFTGLSGTTSTGSLYIFGRHLSTGEGANSPVNGKVYYCKIWDNNVLVRNYIPARRDSDNEAGLYDLVNNTFYPNTGTKGSFIAGPVVSGGYLTKEVATEVMIKHSNLLENTVTFKVEDADYQIVSVKSGNAVSKPAEYNYWKDINENVITFPYTPTSDITLYHRSRLPAGYQEVEYLQSSGTQYIDTGYQVYYFSSTNENVSKTDIEISVNWDETSGQTYQGYGIGSGKNVIPYMGPDNVGLSTRQWTVGSTTSFVKPVGSDADFFGSKHYLKFSGTTATGTIDNNSGNINLSQLTGGSATYWLFAYNAATIRYNKSRCYYCNIWNEGALVRYLIPCYRKSDSKPGMYDTVNNVFYTNQGSGDDFTVGPDVN